MGDVVLTTPIVRCVKEQLNAEVHFLVKSAFSDLVQYSSHISKTHLYKDISDLTSELKEENFDLIIDLQKNRKSKSICSALGVKRITFDKLNTRKWLAVQFNLDMLPDVHIVERKFAPLKNLGVTNDNKGLEVQLLKTSKTGLSTWSLPEHYAVLTIGAQHKGKSMSKDQLVTAIEASSIQVVLVGGEKEKELAESICVQSEKSVINTCGETSIIETAALVEASELVISGDTGVMHLAAAFKVPQISVWGCTTPSLGMYPYLAHSDSIILEPKHHHRRPCSKLGNKCKYAPDWCISSISLVEINEAVSLILKKQGF